ncbi:hypothetical protein BJX70DRAFT_244667 [Aspergillus crustosus]
MNGVGSRGVISAESKDPLEDQFFREMANPDPLITSGAVGLDFRAGVWLATPQVATPTSKSTGIMPKRTPLRAILAVRARESVMEGAPSAPSVSAMVALAFSKQLKGIHAPFSDLERATPPSLVTEEARTWAGKATASRKRPWTNILTTVTWNENQRDFAESFMSLYLGTFIRMTHANIVWVVEHPLFARASWSQ